MRGIPGLRKTFASFRRDVMTADAEGNPVGASSVIWAGRGTFKREGAEVSDDSAGRPQSEQRGIFRCRPSVTPREGDYCTMLNLDWSVEAIETTPDSVRVTIVTPPAQPFI